MNLKTPLGKARGLGSAGHGTQHWIWQRLTAIALLPLSIWFLFALCTLESLEYEAVMAWLRDPLVSTLMLMFTLSLYYHGHLGMQVLIEDYAGSGREKVAGLVLLHFTSFFIALATVVAVLKIAVTG